MNVMLHEPRSEYSRVLIKELPRIALTTLVSAYSLALYYITAYARDFILRY